MVGPQAFDFGACVHLGMLMPASNDAKKDREIFLKILTMDDDGTWQRCKGEIPAAAWREAASPEVQEEFFGARGLKQGMSDEEKEALFAQIWDALSLEQQQALDAQRMRPIPDRAEFEALTYAERLVHCERPENIEGPSPTAWGDINAHLGTTATLLVRTHRATGPAHLWPHAARGRQLLRWRLHSV
jgi:putative DNA methylase